MGKNKKGVKTPPPAPEVKSVETVEPEVINDKKTVNVVAVDELKTIGTSRSGLDANHQVDVVKMIHETWSMDPSVKEKLNVNDDTVKNMRILDAQLQLQVLAQEAMFGNSPFAQMINKTAMDRLITVGNEMGITFDKKLLPVFKNENEVKELPSTAIQVSTETKKKLKEEKEIVEKHLDADPTKIENNDDLAEALIGIIASNPTAYGKLKTAISFYRSYAAIKANQEKNKELATVKDASDMTVLGMVRKSIDEYSKKKERNMCPFIVTGMGRHLAFVTSATKTPIPAYCLFLEAATNRKTGERYLSDNEVADYVKFIVSWVEELNIECANKNIKAHEENLKVLNKDKKANAKGIEDVKTSIETQKKNIEKYNSIIELVTSPSSEVVDALVANYTEKERAAVTIFNHITKNFFADADLKKANPADYKHNVQQIAGVIVNLFRDPTAPLTEYSKANLIDLPKVDPTEETKEEKTAEEPKKE